MQSRESREEPLYRNPAFEACYGEAGAGMHAAAEGEMFVRCACDVERIGTGKLLSVPVGRTDAYRQDGVGLYLHITDLHSFGCETIAELIGALIAQHFLDRGVD